jgi:hypothetical protein
MKKYTRFEMIKMLQSNPSLKAKQITYGDSSPCNDTFCVDKLSRIIVDQYGEPLPILCCEDLSEFTIVCDFATAFKEYLKGKAIISCKGIKYNEDYTDIYLLSNEEIDSDWEIVYE